MLENREGTDNSWRVTGPDYLGRTSSFKETEMAQYGNKAKQKVRKAMRERKAGTLKSGNSGKTVKSRKQAIAIGLSEARRAGAKVPAPKKSAGSRKAGSRGKASSTKGATKKSTTKRSATKKTTTKRKSIGGNRQHVRA